MKTGGFMLKKIVLGNIWQEWFFSIDLRFDYKIGSWLLQCFSSWFLDPFSMVGLFYYI